MKALLACFVLLACVTVTTAQSNTTLEELQHAYKKTSWKDAGELTFDADTKVIAVKNYHIPVSTSTHVRAEKEFARFYMQNNTAVTDVNDASWKRAAFEIPFTDKSSAGEFVKYFEKLKEEQ